MSYDRYERAGYDVTGRLDHGTNLADPEPDTNPVLKFLTESLKRANVNEHETRGALSEMQAKADHLTREREAIERAIKAYQHQENPNRSADR